MQKIISAWHQERLQFQQRYAEYFRKLQANPNDLATAACLHECCYVLTRIFGLSPVQIAELERFDGCGLTDMDLDSGR